MSRARQVSPVLTCGLRRSSPSVNGDKQDETFAVFSPSFAAGTDGMFQVTSYGRIFNTGCLPLTHRRTTTPLRKHDTGEQEHGSSRANR